MDAEYTVAGDAELSPSGKSRIPVIYNGQEAWLYGDDGNQSIRNDRGHWLAPADGKFTITKDNTAAVYGKRLEYAREAATQGALDAVEERGKLLLSHPTEAWQAMTKARTLVALDVDHRGGNAAYELVGKAAGWLSARNESTETPALTLSADGIAALVAAVQQEQGKRQAIEVQVVDVE